MMHAEALNRNPTYSRIISDTLTSFPNTEKRVENTTCKWVFLTNFKASGNVIKHGFSCSVFKHCYAGFLRFNVINYY